VSRQVHIAVALTVSLCFAREAAAQDAPAAPAVPTEAPAEVPPAASPVEVAPAATPKAEVAPPSSVKSSPPADRPAPAATPPLPVAPAERAPDPAETLAAFNVRLVAEAGFFGVLSNEAAFGRDASTIDFRKAAGQDNLQLYTRWSAELDLGRRHTFVFLIQPLSTEGTRTPSVDERFEDVTFRAGGAVRTRFSFPFYRFSYLYEVLQGSDGHLALGFTGQIRNADYTYERLDGSAFARTSDVGFVPALKARGELAFESGMFLGFEVDGIYAPISVLNGSDNETVGAIVDGSLRVGLNVHEQADVFLNLRYLGGGATNEDPNDYAKNWLHFVFIGLGARADLGPPTRVHRPTR
jgi:hypothetical protein